MKEKVSLVYEKNGRRVQKSKENRFFTLTTIVKYLYFQTKEDGGY
jgi:hypothetical protein